MRRLSVRGDRRWTHAAAPSMVVPIPVCTFQVWLAARPAGAEARSRVHLGVAASEVADQRPPSPSSAVALVRRLTVNLRRKDREVAQKAAPMIAAVLVFAMPGAPAVAGPTVESFETGFGGREPDSTGSTWQVTRSADHAYQGTYSVRIFMDGRFDDGTTWIERRFFTTPNQTVTVTLLTFQLWSPTQARVGGWAVAAIASKNNPEQEIDFDRIGSTGGGRLEAVHEDLDLTADSMGGFWVALGTSVLWEVEKSHYVDYVEVTVKS